MKLKIGDKTVKLIDKEVRAANQMLTDFLGKAREFADEQNSSSFYYTLLCVMKIKADERIRALTPETLAIILNAAAESDELKKKIYK